MTPLLFHEHLVGMGALKLRRMIADFTMKLLFLDLGTECLVE